MFEWSRVESYGTALSYATVAVFVILFVMLVSGKFKIPRTRKCLLIFVLFLFAFAIRLPMALIHEISFDEHYYISAGLHYMEGRFLVNYEHPPFIKYMLGAYLKMLYPTAYQDYWDVNVSDYKLLILSRLFMVLFGALSVVPLYFIAEMVVGEGFGLIAAFFFAINPAHARISGLVYLDAPMIFFGLCAVLAALYFLEKPGWKTMSLCGVANGLLFATKWLQPVLFIIPTTLFAIIFYRKKKTLALYALSLIIGLAILIAFWIPQLSLFNFKICDFISLINQHWKPELTLPERDFLSQILYNVSLAEFILYIFCLIASPVLLMLNYKKDANIQPSQFFPLLSTITFAVLVYIEVRKALHYLIPIFPFIALVAAQTLCLTSHFRQMQRSGRML